VEVPFCRSPARIALTARDAGLHFLQPEIKIFCPFPKRGVCHAGWVLPLKSEEKAAVPTMMSEAGRFVGVLHKRRRLFARTDFGICLVQKAKQA
jgi:hypothetical protein